MVTDSINILYDMSEVVTSANSPTTFPPPTYCTSQFSNAIGSSADRQLSGPSDVIIQPEQVKPSSIETAVSIPSIVKRSIPDMSRTVYDNELEDGPTIHAQRLHNLDVQQTPLINEFQCLRINSVKEIFCCMLRNLFKEYNVFPAYSERELILTAHLFICVKECGLISNDKDLRYAICCVLDALKKNPNLKIYDFGIATLDQFRNHQFRTHICKIPHFQQFQPHLIELLNANTTNIYCTLMVKESRKKAIEKHEKVVIPAENVQNNIANRTQIDDTLLVKYSRKKEIEKVNEIILLTKNVKDKLLNTTHIDNNLLVKVNRKNKKRVIEKYDKIVVPDGNVQNKIAFIFNNLSELSLQTKCNEIKNIITEEFLPWFSNYLVMKRVTNEFNFHTLYFNCLDCLKNEALNSLIISETVKNIKVLLKRDKRKVNSSFKPILKNLGHWLGLITLSKNKPISSNDINFKMLLVEAFNKGDQELLITIPFIAKVIESCAKSKLFKPRNPWTMSIMNCLSELHQEPDLKLTLKFEIEVLCKTLNIELKDLKPEYVLRDPEITKKLVPQLFNGEDPKP